MRMKAGNGDVQGSLGWVRGSFARSRGWFSRLGNSVARLPGAFALLRGAAVGRGSIVVATLAAAILLTLVAVPSASAQIWEPFQFIKGGYFEFKIEQYEYSWDDSVWTQESFITFHLRETDMESESGDPLFDVTTSQRRLQSSSDFEYELGIGMLFSPMMFTFGNPFEYGFLVMGLQELEPEVGERTNIFGMGRVIIVDEAAIAGRSGFVVHFEQGEAGNRRLSLEWIVDEELPFPLQSTQYDDQGRVVQKATLVKYEDR